MGRAGRGGPQGAGHRDHQPRDPGDRVALAGRAGAGVARLRQRHRGARDPVGPRPGPADPRGVAGERQAPQPAQLLGLPQPDPGPGARPAGSAPGSGACRRSRTSSTGGATTCLPSTCTWSPCRRRAHRRPAVEAVLPRRSASTASTSTSRPSGSTRRSGVPETALIRRINRKRQQATCTRPTTGRWCASCSPTRRCRGARGRRGWRLPPDVHPWVQELSESWVDEIRRRGLRRRRRARATWSARRRSTEYADPDRPAERQVADAGVDAIKALLLENAPAAPRGGAAARRAARRAPRARAVLPPADVPAAREGGPPAGAEPAGQGGAEGLPRGARAGARGRRSARSARSGRRPR